MTDYEYLINELNLLIGFLDVSDEEIFDKIKTHDKYNLGQTIEELYENKYENYSAHILSSAFILGFTHFEDFVSKCLAKYFEKYPYKNDFKVTSKVISEKGDALISYMALEQSRRLTFSDKIKFIEKNIITVNSESISNLKHANDLRNCLMHNNGVADDRLSGKYEAGKKIILTAGQIHGFGLETRQFAAELWGKINC